MKSSLVVMQRRGPGQGPAPSVFMASPASIGYDATGRSAPNELLALTDRFRALTGTAAVGVTQTYVANAFRDLLA